MTAVAERPAPPAPGRVTAAGKPAGRRVDAVTILTVWVVLLMGIPATLVVAPLGAVGGPATIFAAVVLVFYLVTWLHPALAPAKGRQPVRAAAILLTCAVIGTYVSANRHIMPGLERNGIDRGIILICGWLGVLIMASDGIPSMERLKKLLGRVVIGATAMAILGITQFFTGLDATQYIVIPGLKEQSLNTDLLSRNGLNRPSATAAHPLEFAAVLAMALPIAINRARFAPPGKRGGPLDPGGPDRRGAADDGLAQRRPGGPRGRLRAPADLAEDRAEDRLRRDGPGGRGPLVPGPGADRDVPHPVRHADRRHQHHVAYLGVLQGHAVYLPASVVRPWLRHVLPGDLFLHRRPVPAVSYRDRGRRALRRCWRCSSRAW